MDIDKDILHKLFIEENKTRKEIAAILNTSDNIIKRKLNKYNIRKSKELIIEVKSRIKSKMTKQQTLDMVKKIKQTKLAKYGSETYNNLAKAKQTYKEKTGYDNPSFNPEVAKKISDMLSNKTEEQVKETVKKRRKTKEEKYGNADYFNIEKYKQTCMQKYGVENTFQLEEIKDKIRQTNKEKYGVENNAQKFLSKETLDIISSKEKFTKFISTLEHNTVYEIAEKLGISYPGARNQLRKYDLLGTTNPFRSRYETEIKEIFPDKFQTNRKIIAPLEIDLYNEEAKFGIEFNGDYWHSAEAQASKGYDSNYHLNKTLKAKEKGIFILHLWEYEWNENKDRWIQYIRMLLLKQMPTIRLKKPIIQNIAKEPYQWFRKFKLVTNVPPQLVKGRFEYYDCGYNIYKR
jgi:DNA-binding CsgD family transcriptional regulator